MLKNLQILVPEPCGENWENMDQAGNGRFCSSCCKTVVDFSLMSDQQVLSYLGDPGKKICGRFASDQLNRDFRPVRETGKKPWSVVWRLTLVGMLISAKGQAQQRYPKAAMSKLVKKKGAEKIVKKDFEGVTMGMMMLQPPADQDILDLSIVDSVTQLPVKYATISGPGRQQKFVANSSGEFSLEGVAAREPGMIEISCVGYATKKIMLDSHLLQQKKLTISLTPQIPVLPEVQIIGYRTMGEVRIVAGAVSVIRSERVTAMDTVKRLLSDTLIFCGIKKTLSVYPNPAPRGAQVRLSLDMGRIGPFSLGFFNAAGALIEERKIELTGKSQTEFLGIPASLPGGMYFIRLSSSGSGPVYTQKLVVL